MSDSKPHSSSAEKSAPLISDSPTMLPPEEPQSASAQPPSSTETSISDNPPSSRETSISENPPSSMPTSVSEQSDPSKTPTIAPPMNPGLISQDRYLTTRFHARGGMGEIWLTKDSRLKREVALKKLTAKGEHAKARFLAEAEVTGQLEHPAIVPVHDVGVDGDGKPYYVMKFVRGRSLKQAIEDYYTATRQGNPEVRWLRLLQTFVDLCHAVAYAHSRGVLHRDLKPDNIMLGPYGETLVLDWGLAKVRGQEEIGGGSMISATSLGSGVGTETQLGSIMGSPLYMAPEMADGRILDIDERTDVYLLGATLYEILTSKTPREGRSRDEIVDLARTTTPVPPRKVRKSVPKPLDAICMKALSRFKAERYLSAMEMAQDMERYLAGEPVSAYPETITERIWRWARKHQRALKRIAAAVAIAAIALFVFVKFRQIEQRQRLAQLQAAELQHREQARAQIQTFNSLADEARFYAASTDPIAEHAPYYDADKALLAARAALAAAANWGDNLQDLPLPEAAPHLRSQIYELLLIMAQNELRASPPAPAKDLLSLLNQAARINPTPSQGYYRLLAQYFQMQDDPARAQEQKAIADNPGTPSIAFDYFLLGEELRRTSASAPPSPDSADAMTSAGAQNLTQAIDAYRKAIAIDPSHYWAHFQLGRCYLSQGKLPEAIEALGACIALRPDAPWGYSARGMALGLLHRYDEAEADLNHAIQLDPDFRPARLNRGVIYQMQGKRDAALADFAAVLQPPEDRMLIEAAYYRSQLYIDSGDYDDALTDLDSVILAKKDFYPAYLLRARVHLLQGARDASLQDLAAELRQSTGGAFDPDSAKDLGQRGSMLRHIAAELPGDAARITLDLARADLQTAVQSGGRSASVYADLGAVLDLLGQTNESIQAYSSALQLDPADVQVRINRGWAYQKSGQLDPAGADFAAAIQSDPTNAEAYTGLGYIRASQKDYDSARAQAVRALLYGSNDYLILHNVACIYAVMSDTDTIHQTDDQDLAISMLQRAVGFWRDGKRGPDEVRLIEQEPAFPPALRARPEFQQLLTTAAPTTPP